MKNYLVYLQLGDRSKEDYELVSRSLPSKKRARSIANSWLPKRAIVVKIIILSSIADANIVYDNTDKRRY